MNTPIPEDFQKGISSIAGRDTEAFVSALNGEPSLSIHVNPGKCIRAGLQIPDNAEKVAWASHGYYLKSRPRFTFDPLMHAGAYYVEEPSSMFVEQALRRITSETKPEKVLDLCAAPGGKSVMMRSIVDGGLLVANEPVAKRAAVLAENIAKWGDPDVVVTSNYPGDFAMLKGFFDIIATDVPCSGEGMFRKDETARTEWSKENVEACTARQREILRDIWSSLRYGGFLIYSTCTFNRHEDEDNVAWICSELGAETVELNIEKAWNISGDATGRNMPVYHFFPHKTKGEGFFLALLRKTGGEETQAASRKSKNAPASTVKAEGYRDWLCHSSEFGFYKNSDGIFALRSCHAAAYGLLAQNLNILQAGIQVCNGKTAKHPANGRKNKPQYIPAPQLALSSEFNGKAFPTVSLNYGNAVKYLRGESVAYGGDAPRGRVVVAYRNLPLGFANNIGTRLNNAFPASWRIRSTYAPQEAPELEF